MSTITPLDSYASGNVGTYDVMGQGAINMLESITPVEKGLSVPFVEIWQINPANGQPLFGKNGIPSYPLTMQTIAPPVFGLSSEEFSELRERPAVSLESITIKTNNPQGLILWRQLDIKFIVHRPDVLAGTPPQDRDSWTSLITPGSILAMEYGWIANEGQVKNPILNGSDAEGTTSQGRKWSVQGRKTIRFAIVSYRFTILPDQQISVSVSAIEDGEFGLRNTYVVRGVRPTRDPNNSGRIRKYDNDKFHAEFNSHVKELRQKFKTKLNSASRLLNKSVGSVVRMEDVFKIFFSDEVEESVRELGYKNVTFTMGCCNIKTPTPLDKYSWQKPKDGRQTPKYYIGDFCLPLKYVLRTMNDMISRGTELTSLNFILSFLRKMSDPTSWKNEQDKNVTMPDIQVRFMPIRNTDGTQSAHIFVVDIKTELMRFTDDDRKSYEQWAKENSRSASNVANRDQIRKICVSKGIPYVEMMKGNSWIQDAQFDVIQDELIQSIMINRYYPKDRYEIVGKTESQIRADTWNHLKVLYSSAISGQLTVIGNHGMDVMGMYWIDFGVPQWSGPFRLVERQDIIDRNGWQTTVRLISEGSDPLGSQGRERPVELVGVGKSTGPKKTTSNKKKSMNKWAVVHKTTGASVSSFPTKSQAEAYLNGIPALKSNYIVKAIY